MIRFAHPEYFNLLWIAAAALLLALVEHRWRKAAMRRWASEVMWDSALPHRAPGRLLAKRLLLAGAVALAAIGAAGPQVGTRLMEAKREGSDVVIALDVSNSMLTEDLTPNRMEKARYEIARLLKLLHGDRVALTPFAGVAFVQVPLTLDYSAVMSLLNAIEPGMIPQPGTSLAAAIEQSRRAFKGGEREREDATGAAQKVILLISDGEDHEEGAVQQAKEAAKEGIIIYVVGMASPAGGPIPIRDERGRVSGYKKDDKGGTVISRLNESLLKDIAQATGGEYYPATNVGGEFQQIYKKIQGLDKAEYESKTYTDYEDRFQWLLAGALLLVTIQGIIPPARRKK